MFHVHDKCTYKNGKSYREHRDNFEKNYVTNFLQKIQINEWTFSLFLFILSLTIVATKVAVMYGHFLPIKTSNLLITPSVSVMGRFNPDYYNYMLFNATREYKSTVNDTIIKFIDKFGWFIKAAVSGISLMGFTWFIIYKDSRIPGVNPPSPFSPNKRKVCDESRLQINYLIGIVNGILIFLYMCF